MLSLVVRSSLIFVQYLCYHLSFVIDIILATRDNLLPLEVCTLKIVIVISLRKAILNLSDFHS